MYHILFKSVSSLLNLKGNTTKALKRLNIENLRDLLFYKPYSYSISDISSNLTNLEHNQLVQAEVVIGEIQRPSSRKQPIRIHVYNNTGDLILVFFNQIPLFIFQKLRTGAKVIVSGKVQNFNGTFQITHPDFVFNKESANPVEPIYHLTYGLINKQLYIYVLQGIKLLENNINLNLSFKKQDEHQFAAEADEINYMQSLLHEIKSLHLLDVKADSVAIEKIIELTTQKLSAKELFANQAALSILRKTQAANHGRVFLPQANKKSILDNLGFSLTDAQNQALAEIEEDQASPYQMMRLLQGDVGSGKTLVALLTMFNVVKAGAQCALMAPTDLLSLQHFQFFSKALLGQNINISLLTGKNTEKEKRLIKQQLASGEINILIGTHALFQDNVEFADLGYIIIDEQHRFGVNQRMELIGKASHPDVLVMTATPIPRSLTLTIFGDMKVSLLKSKPKNRLPIITSLISTDKKAQVIASLHKKLDIGEKIYWICPLVEATDTDEKTTTKNDYAYADVTNMFIELEQIFPQKVGILHGKMKSSEKDQVMEKFKTGAIKILVATTVVEVGIDVPDATLIIIENAEKFGLAQLHQLRGRVGRGALQSHCLLMYNYKRLSQVARKRLETMRESNDGFFISEQDLILRGGGEILGTKQSGEPNFFFADLGRDKEILLKANKSASEISRSNFINFQIRLFDREKQELVKSG